MMSGIRGQSPRMWFTSVCILVCLSDAVIALAISYEVHPLLRNNFRDDFESVNHKSHFGDYDGNLDT